MSIDLNGKVADTIPHTIVTKVYEKGPQTLSEAIKEVEKLQVAQQITSTLLPTSSVNTMSSDNDRCF